ncbi:ABC transporter substrate-binding protein [candidate division CSSED10-310 bacterium]|uniref:ABC transporter substrate-binding protein n=1 Tax=candidate division CSSED10-310 bacterium TaxID=2855610 RepID=A0ABV6YWS8_UNCC1
MSLHQSHGKFRERQLKSGLQHTSLLFPLILCLGFLLLSHSSCSRRSLTSPLRLGTIENELALFPLLVMEQKKLLYREGFTDIRWQKYPDFTSLLADFQKGECAGGGGPIFPIIQGIVSGRIEAVILSPLSLNGYCLLVKAENRYADFKVLSGKKIALQSCPSLEEFLLEKAFLEHGLSRIDLNVEVMPFSQMEAALLNGDVAALVMAEPKSSLLLQNEKISLYMLSEKIWSNHPHTAFFISSDVLREKPAALHPLLLAHFETLDWLIRNKTVLSSYAAKNYPFNHNISSLAISRFTYATTFSFLDIHALESFTVRKLGVVGSKFPVVSPQFIKDQVLQAKQDFFSRKQKQRSSLPK